MSNIKIAIDGPSGAGKSTIAKIVANDLGFVYIDTGAMYRAVGLKALRKHYDTKIDTVKIINMMEDIKIDIDHNENGQLVVLDDEDVTTLIRTPEISIAASDVSAIPQVRQKLVYLQQQLARTKNVIMDGRDIGTHVLPDAQIKLFLTASLDSRAKRRYDELMEKKIECNFESVKSDMELRDLNDSTRAASPLKIADGAIVLDTSDNTLEKSVALVTSIIKERLNDL